jgi:hypothetical protein
VIRSRTIVTTLGAFVLATLSTGCAMQTASLLPSSWARTYPDTSVTTSGRVVRFAGNYGLLGPSPAVVFRDVNNSVSGQVLVWYRRYEPTDVKKRSSADSAAQWAGWQAEMDADRAKFNAEYGCTTWAKGFQGRPVWVCRVPEQNGVVNWAAQLARVDSLVGAQRSGEQSGRRRTDPQPPPAPNSGVTNIGGREGTCMDGGNWSIVTRDTRGVKSLVSPQPGGDCPKPKGPAGLYDQAGWNMLRGLVAAVVTVKNQK